MIRDSLESRGIPAKVVGAKDYSSHVMGIGHGQYQIWVDEGDFERTQAALAKMTSNLKLTGEIEERITPNYFRRSVFFAFVAAIIGPILFNFASLANLRRHWRHSEKSSSDILKVLFVVALQGLTLVVIYSTYHHWFE